MLAQLGTPTAVAAASLAAGGLALAVTPAAADAAPDLDFFADSVSGLRAGSVFESVTYERFESLLNSDGTFAKSLSDVRPSRII